MAHPATNVDELKILLKKVDEIRWKYHELLRQSWHTFNVFPLLRSEDDEVHLHSRFLSELFNPKGVHGQGDTFLKLFLNQLGISNFELENVRVKREYRNIDIFITNEHKQAIVIENKIHAGDQPQQLERYHREAKKRGATKIFIIYLTLDGDEPSKQSLGSLRKLSEDVVTLASYENDINNWLEECIKQVALFPALRETLVQYQQLIQKLTGQSILKGHIMEIKELLLDEKNIELATYISQALTDAKIEIQLSFWKELDKRLAKQGYESIDRSRYSADKVKKYYKQRTKNRYYGLTFTLSTVSDTEEIYFKIELGWDIYYGFRVRRDGHVKIAQEAQYDQLAELIETIAPEFQRNEWWLGQKKPDRALNFDAFNDANVFALADPKQRSKYIDELVAEVTGHMGEFKKLYRRQTNHSN